MKHRFGSRNGLTIITPSNLPGEVVSPIFTALGYLGLQILACKEVILPSDQVPNGASLDLPNFENQV